MCVCTFVCVRVFVRVAVSSTQDAAQTQGTAACDALAHDQCMFEKTPKEQTEAAGVSCLTYSKGQR